MFFSGKYHGFFLLQSVLISREVQIATIWGPSPSDEDFPSWQSTSRSIVLYFAVVDSCEGIAIGDGTESQDLFSLSEKTNFRVNLMTDLDKSLFPCEWHNQSRELHYGWLPMFFDVDLVDNELFLCLFLLLYFLEELHNSDPFLRIVFQISS